MPVQSKYQFTEYPDGFTITAPQRVPVRVTLCPTGFRVKVEGLIQLMLFPELDAEGEPPLAASLPQYQRLVHAVTETVMSKWTSPRGGESRWPIEKWAREKTRRALGGRIHEQWRRLTAKADPVIWSVQKAIFAAAPFSDVPLLHAPGLYEDPYLASDIRSYRAAATVVSMADELCHFHDEQAARRNAAPAGATDADQEEEEYFGPSPEYVVDQLVADWQGLCSPTCAPYGSLSRTLMQLPGGISLHALGAFPLVYLVRPMTDRLELATLLLAARVEDELSDDDCPSRFRVFYHARRAEIREAMELVSTDVGEPLSHRRTNDIATFVRYLYDFPEDHRGGLRSLARKAVHWHRTVGQRRRALAELQRRIREETLTQQPPIPLPEIDGVRFLASVADILDEGERMRHCIGYYAERAVAGECYLFHVDYRGESASVEVNKFGKVRQAHGPDNQPNRASRYGDLVLSRWGASFESDAEPFEDDRPYCEADYYEAAYA